MSPLSSYKEAESSFVGKITKLLSAITMKTSSAFNNMMDAGKQRFTVMLIPHSEKKIFNFRISVFSLIVIVFLMSCMLTSFVIFTTQFKGMSGLIKTRSETLEKRETDIEIIRDQIAELKRVSRVFEASLLNTLGISNTTSSSARAQGSDFISFFSNNRSQEELLLRELEDLRNLSHFLQNSVESLEQVRELLAAQGDLLVELPSIWPVQNGRGRVTNTFGPAIHPFTKQWYLHRGIDIAYARGTPIVSTANGKVIERGFDVTGFGNFVVIRHMYGFFTQYAHLDQVYVREGQTVRQGQVIGTMGNTGLSTAPHLHYEVRIGSQVVDPERYLNIRGRSGN
ncbi:MAG: M23 family metallopeptidase [Spirochaetaceae bacterium]|nr:M23 family metallopeptidase [Spirochaetaceae bacterium]